MASFDPLPDPRRPDLRERAEAAEQRVAELEAERDNCLTAITNLKRDRAELEAALREIAGLELVVSSYGAAYVVFEKAKATARDALKGQGADS